MWYVMFRGQYLKKGSDHPNAWTKNILIAQQYETKEAADKDKCGNESSVYISRAI